MAQPISGAGPHAFDTVGATTDGLPDPLCQSFGTDQIEGDVWFAWTATTDGNHRFSTCGSAGDTRIAVYDNMCGGAALACNDDACGLLSELTFSATSGTTYLLRVGNYPGTSGANGDFSVTPTRVFNPNNGSTYELVTEFLSWNAAKTEAESALLNGVPGHLAVISDQAELDWILNNLSPSRPWIGLFQDLNSPNYSEPAGGWSWVTGEPFTFQNWNPGEPNENPPAGGGPENFGEMFANGDFNDAQDFHPQIQQYLIEWSGSGSLGTRYCNPTNNSTGGAASIAAEGSIIASDNDLTLSASGVPALQFGIFLTSLNQASTPVASGILCLGGSIIRFQGPGQILQADMNGEYSLGIDISALPAGTPTPIVAGDTYNFTTWFRDVDPMIGNTANFSDGVSITFQ